MCWFFGGGVRLHPQPGPLRAAAGRLCAAGPGALCAGAGVRAVQHAVHAAFVLFDAVGAGRAARAAAVRAGGAGACLCHRVLRLAAAGRLLHPDVRFLRGRSRRWLGLCFVLAAGLFLLFNYSNYAFAGYPPAAALLHAAPTCLGVLAAGGTILFFVQRPAQRPGPAAPGGGQIFLLLRFTPPIWLCWPRCGWHRGHDRLRVSDKDPRRPSGRRTAGSL